jgi:hypothetical protein
VPACSALRQGGTRRPVTTIDLADDLAGFQGTLQEIGLPSLLGILEMERRTGTIVLDLRPGRMQARLYLRKGRVLRAQLDGAEGPRNAELVHRLIACSRGTFDFRPSIVGLGDDIRCSTGQLILQSVRRLNQPRPARRSEVRPAMGRRSPHDAVRLPTRAGLGTMMAIGFILLLLTTGLWSGPWALVSSDPAPAARSSVTAPGSAAR